MNAARRRAATGAVAVLSAASLVAADPPAAPERPRHHNSAAQRASDGRRSRRRFQRTLDPTTRNGQPVRVERRSAPVALEAPAPLPAPAAGERPYDHVVVVSLDGLRPDAIDLTDAPNLALLRDQGAHATEARTITHSYTLPSHTSMLSGVDVDRHGLRHNNFTPRHGFTRAPTLFFYAHDEGFTTAMFVSKPKFRHIAVPGTVDVFTRPDYACERVVRAAALHLRAAGPGVTFVHLSEPDEYGHSRGWMTAPYLRGIATADRCLGTLLLALRERRDRVLLLVSSDHGGHGRTHGSERDEDMRIPWIAWGARVAPGAFANPVNTMDTAATVLAALGVARPAGWAGRPVPRVFERSAPGEAPASGPPRALDEAASAAPAQPVAPRASSPHTPEP